MKIKKTIAFILSCCLLCSFWGEIVPAFATGSYSTTITETDEVTDDTFVLPDIIDAAEAKLKDYVARLKAEEADLNTFIFASGDGTQTMRIFSHPVKYVADDGSIRDISLRIRKKLNGFVTEDHEIITTFARKLSDGISLNFRDIEVTLIPQIEDLPKDGLIDNGSPVCQYAKYADTIDEVTRLRQMWKVTYLGKDRYSIRPMNDIVNNSWHINISLKRYNKKIVP